MPPDAAVCEVGWCQVRTYADEPAEIGDPLGMLVNPNRPMPPEARAIHHIGDSDLADSPAIETGFLALFSGEPDVFAAHNCAFERSFFTGGATPWICTLKVARRLWPDSPSHSNQCLRYFLGVQIDEALAMPPHRAAPDAYVTAAILLEALKHTTVEQMIEWTSQPSLLPGAINFGKHKGVLWSQCDPSYLDWMARQPDMDEDKVFTAKYWLTRRRNDDR
jgi:exodeoxyribonuclease X